MVKAIRMDGHTDGLCRMDNGEEGSNGRSFILHTLTTTGP